jgi:hypothetical protein
MVENTETVMAFKKSGCVGLGLMLYATLSACGGGSSSDAGPTIAPPATATPTTATVNMVVTDTPSTAITILSFQVQITGAVLQPGSVGLLPRPVTVDLAQLVSDAGLLFSTVSGSATYTSLDMTFANPQVTLINNTGSTLSLAGQGCAAGATCTFIPALNNATVTLSNGVFPIAVTAGSSTGLSMDLSIPDLLQSDLSVSFANGTSVNLSLLSGSSSTSQQASIDDVVGTVTAVSGTEVDIKTALGDSLVLTEESSTAYAFPSSVCATNDATCVSTGQTVSVDLGLLGDGSLSVHSMAYLGSSGSLLAKGLVLSVNATAATPTVQILIQGEVNSPSLTPGEIATVSLPAGTVFSVGTVAYPTASTLTFGDAADLMPGQEVVLGVGSDLVAGSAPTFSANSAILESSQVVGEVNSVDATSASLSMNGLSGLFTGARPLVQLMDVQTGTATTFAGFTTASLSAVSAGQFVVAKGPLFGGASSGTPTLAAIQVTTRGTGN